MENLRKKFIERKYPTELVESQFEKAKLKDRKAIIFQERKKKNKGDKKVRLIFTHNRGNPPLHKWMRDSKTFLVSTRGKEFGRNMQIAGCNNSQVEVEWGQTKPPNEAGSFKCNHCRVSCPILEETRRFRSTNTDRSYPIKQKMT